MEADSKVILRWSAYEHEHIERSNDWFWALGIIATCAAIISIIFHDYFFAILIITAAITLGVLAVHPPQETQFEVSHRGIRVGDKMHHWREIISFWVEEEHHEGRPLLLIDTVKFMSPNLIIPIEHVDPSLVRALFKEHVPEVHMREPVFHKILEFFGL